MKKLSALIIGLCLIGFMSTNASAACDCGYIWELGPGTITQHINITTTPVTPLSVVATSVCGTYTMTQAIPATCQSQQFSPVYVDPVTGDGRQTFYIQIKDWGTATLSDYVNGSVTGDQCDVILDEAQLSITGVFTTHGNFQSNQTGDCDIDFGAYISHPGGFDIADEQEIFNVYRGYVDGKPEVGVEIRQTAYLISFDGSDPFDAVIIQGITGLRVEYFSRLRGDLNNDGSVNLSDFNIFKGNFLSSVTCVCGSYFQ
jgi:hypothetical protein